MCWINSQTNKYTSSEPECVVRVCVQRPRIESWKARAWERAREREQGGEKEKPTERHTINKFVFHQMAFCLFACLCVCSSLVEHYYFFLFFVVVVDFIVEIIIEKRAKWQREKWTRKREGERGWQRKFTAAHFQWNVWIRCVNNF